MSDVVLLVFEGEKTERLVFNNLRVNYFTEKNSIIHATFAAEIYQLWEKVRDDEFLDIVELIRERSNKNQDDLKGISRDDVSQIFLFFDYDGHATNASDEVIEQMLRIFNNETGNGKLYISYPMVEALKHFTTNESFKDVVVDAKKNIAYKKLVNPVSIYQDLRKLTVESWRHIILENYKKVHYLVNDIWDLPLYPDVSRLNQSVIFKQQLNKFISPNNQVAVLSAFPFFIIEYFGEPVFNTLDEHLLPDTITEPA